MQIFKKNNSWAFRFDVAKIDGQRKRVLKAGFKTKKEAEAAGTKARNEYNNAGVTFTPSEISVADFYTVYLDGYCKSNCKLTTIEGYKKRIKNYILPAIGMYRLKAITPSILQDLINKHFNQGMSMNSLSSLKGLLTGAFSYAVHPLGLIQYSPAAVIKLPSKRAVPKIPSRKKEKVLVSDDEFAIILKRFPEGHPAHIPLILAHRLGLREGEAFGIQTDRDIDFDNNLLTVNEQAQWIYDEDLKKSVWTLTLPKYDSTRQVYMDSELAELLKRTIEKQNQNRIEYGEFYKRLFVNKKNQITACDTGKEIFMLTVREDGSYISSQTITHACRVIHYKLGIKHFEYHALRHTHATTLDTNGASLLDIKERLGHCFLKTTERYTHNNKTLRDRTNNIIDSIYKKKITDED